MKPIDTEDMKKIQLEILDYVHRFCVENQIDYFLDCGTLLGAIRHQGYIPWDDDIDVGMLRPQYERFASLFNKTRSKYRFLCCEENDTYCYPFGKVVDTTTVLYEPDKDGNKIAVNIDIFPYDNAPTDPRAQQKQFLLRKIYRVCNIAHTRKKDYEKGVARAVVFHVMHVLTMPFPKNYFARKMSENAKRYRHTETGIVTDYTDYITAICEKQVFESFADAAFEGRIYKIPKEYDTWLRLMFGDYMTPPPEDQRVTTHIFEAYYLDE